MFNPSGPSAGTLAIGDNGTQDFSLNLQGSYGNEQFALQAPNFGEQNVLMSIACFAAGTKLATRRGEIPVEHLRVGCVPHRDLWLSPDHAVFIDGVLIPVRHLINGTTIEQVPVDSITYYHVELDRHDVVLAEGMPVESYLDTDDRANFANGAGVVALHADFSAFKWEADAYAPLVVTGAKLDAARRQVAVRPVETERFEVAMRASRLR